MVLYRFVKGLTDRVRYRYDNDRPLRFVTYRYRTESTECGPWGVITCSSNSVRNSVCGNGRVLRYAVVLCGIRIVRIVGKMLLHALFGSCEAFHENF